MYKRILSIILTSLLVLCISCGNKAGNIGFGPPEREIEKLYRRADGAYNKLAEGKLRNSRRNWDNVIRQFDEIVGDYPDSSIADDAQYKLGSSYVRTHELLENSPQKAVEAFEYLIKQYPDSEFVDDAYYWKAYACSLQGDFRTAAEEYEEFTRKYRQSELYDEAVSQMKKCRLKLGSEANNQPEEGPASEYETPKPLPAEETDNLGPEVSDQKRDVQTELTVSQPRDVPATDSVAPQEQERPADLSGFSHVTDIRFQSAPESTRVVIELSGLVRYEVGTLEDPDRIYVDLQTAIIAPAKRTIEINDKAVKAVRAAQFDENTVRVVLDIKQIQNHKTSYLKDPDRIVVDIYGSNAAYVPPSESPPSEHQEPVPLVKQLGLKVKTIVIDPGHGGEDPGAVSRAGTHEKLIVLDVAKRLKGLLESRGAYQVHLTRETDVSIPLGQRTAFANNKDADIFISLHINSCERPEARGIETYYLSLASDEEARATAALENASAGKTISDLSSMLRHILRGAKVDESRELARTIQSRLCYRTGTNDRGVRRAPFMVLIGAEAPSVLVELGFMSNSQDENLLLNEEYRAKLARALMEGVEIYIGTIDQTNQ